MLYIVPVPVGNLEDITLRALKLFEKADIILCEDGRTTSKLLTLLGIGNKPRYVNLSHNHKFNYNKISSILDENLLNEKVYNNQYKFYYKSRKSVTKDEKIILLVSDAGTAGISDPGYEVVKLAQEKDITYSCLPGATAVIPAVVNSNLISKEFLFLGFLPVKKGRMTKWKSIIQSQIPVVMYESSHRIEKLFLEIITNLESERKISFSREISKKFEEVFVGTVKDLNGFELSKKGEFVVVISGVR